MRVYTSRLLGREPALVLHGGGNTSVKAKEKNFFGEEEEVIHVKGSGWDLATIEAAGFAPVRMSVLLKLAELPKLSDDDMVVQMRAGMLNPAAPTPSVEAILHAALPFKYVDHTHADAVIALVNNAKGRERVEQVFGKRVLVVPYIMPGFVLAKAVHEMIQGVDFSQLDGMILMNHGAFTWGNDAKESYERMIALVTKAEEAVAKELPANWLATAEAKEDLVGLATLRKAVSKVRGVPVLARLDASPEAAGFSLLPNVASCATRGPLTPDHSIRTKVVPVIAGEDLAASVNAYVADYAAYFQRNAGAGHTMLQQAPAWAVWPGHGVVAFGATQAETGIVSDIAAHTLRVIQQGEALGGWQALPEKDVFEVEYWSLEQAKLKGGPARKPLQGKVAIVSGSAAGIGLACAKVLAEHGACVVGLDLNPEILEVLQGPNTMGMVVNLTDHDATLKAVEATVRKFGGLDIVVSNAGIFTAGQYLDQLDDSNWAKSMAVNLTSHQQLMKAVIPYLKQGIDGTVIFIGSRNVAAPGAGAASYSVAKAGLTQLCRVAALELAPFGVRANICHPDAVFDTKLWTPEALQRSAERYGITVEEYKKRNLMKCEIKSRDVGEMIATMAGPAFSKTTGAQIPVDGGNDRVI